MYIIIISGIPANWKTLRSTTDKIINMKREALSLKFHVLNFRAINLTGAFNKKQLTKVKTIKNQGFKIIEFITSLF